MSCPECDHKQDKIESRDTDVHMNVHMSSLKEVWKKENPYFYARSFSATWAGKQGVAPRITGAPGVKNKNQQTYHSKGCSHAKAIGSGSKHAQTALAKRRKWWYASIHCSSNLSAFINTRIYSHTCTEHFLQSSTSPLKKAFIVEILSHISLQTVQDVHCSIKRGLNDRQRPFSSLWTSSKWELIYACAVLGLTTVYC